MAFATAMGPRQHQIDYLGSLLMFGLGATMTVAVQAQCLDLFVTVLLTVAGIGALAWLALQERRAQQPIVPVALLRNRVIAV